MATTPRQRIAAILRSHTAKRLRFTAPTTWVGDITIDQTTFETVAKAIDDIRIQITVQPRAAFPPASAQHPAQPTSTRISHVTVAGFISGEPKVQPIVGRDQEGDVMQWLSRSLLQCASAA